MVGWRGCEDASGAALSSVLTFLREAAVVAAVLSLGSRGLRVFFSLGLPSSVGLPSVVISFFLRWRLTFTGGAASFAADAFADEAVAFAFVRLDESAEFAAEAATPPPRTSGFEGCGRATRMVSEAKPTFCGDVGGEEMDEELCSDAASSIRILSPKPGGMAIAGWAGE
jgi:hypothetical protein